MTGSVSAYDNKPWLQLYGEGRPRSITPEHEDLLAIFRAAVARASAATALHYFDGRLSFGELDQLSDRLATWLAGHGVGAGDRIAIVLQNTPGFVISALAAWKRGAIPVPINPMNRERELGLLCGDSQPKVVICHPDQQAVIASVLAADPALAAARVLTSAARAFQSRQDARALPKSEPGPTAGALDLAEILSDASLEPPPPAPLQGSDIAFLVYTSGTTGLPKGAMITHANAAFNAQVYRDWIGLKEGGGVLALAPLFHVTGLIGHIAAAFVTASPLVLSYRFEPQVMLDALAEHRPQFTIGAITAFIAVMNAPGASLDHFASLERVYSGGAPIPPSVVEAFEGRFGIYIHNGYGLTETTSPSHVVPFGARAPVDPVSGALSIGIPVFNTIARVELEDGSPAPPGEYGEIVTKGPMVVPGYWNKPNETAEAITDGWLHTGDIGFMDQAGWFYLVDRKKDMINAAGFKVWPREVEDVIYTHPAIREAAVVGVQDAYRGETVKAVISLKPGQAVTAAELVEFCKARMAAYKYPRLVEIVDDLPKTATGKILRRELR
jgi:long-chain acyl-CoA synthetase